jgi:hypothetical protein
MAREAIGAYPPCTYRKLRNESRDDHQAEPSVLLTASTLRAGRVNAHLSAHPQKRVDEAPAVAARPALTGSSDRHEVPKHGTELRLTSRHQA